MNAEIENADTEFRRRFIDGAGRVATIPRKDVYRQALLRYAARRFEDDRAYTEQEVNFILLDIVDDHAWLRRMLVDLGYLERSDDGRAYRRTPTKRAE